MGDADLFEVNGKVFSDSYAYGKYINDVFEENYEQIYKYIPKLAEGSLTTVNFKGYTCRLTITEWYRITMVIEIESLLEHYMVLYPDYQIDCNMNNLVAFLDQNDYIMVNLTSNPLVIKNKNKYWLRQRILEVVELEEYLLMLTPYKI